MASEQLWVSLLRPRRIHSHLVLNTSPLSILRISRNGSRIQSTNSIELAFTRIEACNFRCVLTFQFSGYPIRSPESVGAFSHLTVAER